MPAITAIPSQYPTQYDNNWWALAQQKPSQLDPYVTHERVRGKEKRFQQLGQRAWLPIVGRAQQTRVSDQAISNRWLTPYPFDDASTFDEWDEEYLGEIVLPKSAVLQQSVYAYNRLKDSVIITAALGTAVTGDQKQTNTVLPASSIVAVDFVEQGTPANSGLTISKLRQAKYLMDFQDVDDEGRVIAVSAKQLQDLLRTTEVTSADYNTVKALAAGQIDTFLGFKFVRVYASAFPYNATTDIRTVVAMQMSGMALSDSGVKSYMDILPTQSHALQVRSTASIGATRTEEAKVVAIFTDESP